MSGECAERTTDGRFADGGEVKMMSFGSDFSSVAHAVHATKD